MIVTHIRRGSRAYSPVVDSVVAGDRETSHEMAMVSADPLNSTWVAIERVRQGLGVRLYLLSTLCVDRLPK